MKKINLLIVEDSYEEAQQLKNYLSTQNFHVIGIANTLEEALEVYNSKKHSIDFIIIDIYLDEKPEGIEFAKFLNERKEHICPFLFLTASTERTIFEAAKSTQPHGYLLKPYNELELSYTIELIFETYNKEKETSIQWLAKNKLLPFFIKKKDAFVKVEADDIFYLEAEGRYCNIIISEANFIVQNTLSNLFKKLSLSSFIRTHRKYIINKKYIKEVYLKDNLIVMKENKKALIGRAYKEDFFMQYNVIK